MGRCCGRHSRCGSRRQWEKMLFNHKRTNFDVSPSFQRHSIHFRSRRSLSHYRARSKRVSTVACFVRNFRIGVKTLSYHVKQAMSTVCACYATLTLPGTIDCVSKHWRIESMTASLLSACTNGLWHLEYPSSNVFIIGNSKSQYFYPGSPRPTSVSTLLTLRRFGSPSSNVLS